MDVLSLIGIALAFAAVVGGNFLEGGEFSSLVNIPAAVVMGLLTTAVAPYGARLAQMCAAKGCISRAVWRENYAKPRRKTLPNTPATLPEMSILAGAIWCWPPFTARPLCAMRRAVGAMPRCMISRIS